MISVESVIPIDMVFTYVDGNDPIHVEKRNLYKPSQPVVALSEKISDTGDSDIRFRDVGEISFGVNSVLKYLPWIRKVFIVTDDQRTPVSKQLLNSGRVLIIDHREFIPSRYLPTFNNKTIESHLHHIEGLSEIFLYNNDDYMHFSPIHPSFFFTRDKDGLILLKLHAYPALYRWVKRQYSFVSKYRANLHTIGISNAYEYLKKCKHSLGLHEILMPMHATRVLRKSTALRVEAEFEGILEETRCRKFRDAEGLSYDTILYSMEKKWNPRDQLYLHIFGDLFAPNAMFDFPMTSISKYRDRFWERVSKSDARLACVNNVPLSERRRFEEVMAKKRLGDSFLPYGE
jgi:hypothetical protein